MGSLGRPKRPDDEDRKPEKPPKADKPVTTPASAGLGAPSGRIKALSDGTEWSAINRWDGDILKAASEFGVPPSRVKAHIVIESRGEPKAIQRNPQGASFGLMQVVPRWWRSEIGQLAGKSYLTDEDAGQAMISDPLLAIRAGCRVLQVFRDDHNETWDQASSRFFTGGPNWAGSDTVNGTTGKTYKQTLDALMSEIDGAAGTGTTPAPKPGPADPIATIMGGAYPYIDYGWKAPTSLPFYAYFEGHGGSPNQHTGLDVPGQFGQVLHSPGPGLVTCAGTGVGAGSWGSGCSAFADEMGKGAGRVEIMLDTGVSLILGHCSESLVKPGQRVTTGQPVARMGGMNSGWHTHIEARVWREDGRCPNN